MQKYNHKNTLESNTTKFKVKLMLDEKIDDILSDYDNLKKEEKLKEEQENQKKLQAIKLEKVTIPETIEKDVSIDTEVILTEENIHNKTIESKPLKEKDIVEPQKLSEESIELITGKVQESLKETIKSFQQEVLQNTTDNLESSFSEEISIIKNDLENLKEAIFEILNLTIHEGHKIKESIQPSQRRIIINRDESGKIISADLAIESKDE